MTFPHKKSPFPHKKKMKKNAMSKHTRNQEKQKNTQKSTLVIKKIVFTHKIEQKSPLNFKCFSEY